MNRIHVVLEDGRVGDLYVTGQACETGWRGWVRFKPPDGPAEVVDCPEVDSTLGLALARADSMGHVLLPTLSIVT